MQKNHKQKACAQKTYVVHSCDLPLSCPTKDMTLWNAHPRVYLPIDKTGKEKCPYCSTEFILAND